METSGPFRYANFGYADYRSGPNWIEQKMSSYLGMGAPGECNFRINLQLQKNKS